ncbi:MAG TPA: thioether cross-link-forming SCIFF peptide maturase, partial [Firmicutes bacterium]|nr:thioether cross-link-forming SCIFF peptide maturase [Bacillota bacterium]
MVHTFSLLGQNIAVDVNSGAVHILDDTAYAVVQAMENKTTPLDAVCEKLPQYSRAALEESYRELQELIARGELFADADYIDPAMAVIRNAPIKALCLHVSHDCNLRCKYCFASTGDFGTGRLLMDADTAKAAIDFVIERSGARRNIEIDFFGGEPLMAMDVVKETVAYARSREAESGKHFRFTITTNGVLLDDDTIDYINREMDNCVLSLDGRKEVNDRFRVSPNGKGSYDVIVPKFKKLVAERGDKDFYLRGTFTRKNLDFAKDVLAIADEGFRQISVEPVSAEDQYDYALREEDLPAICAEYEKLAQIMMDRRDFNFFHFNVDLSQGPCVIKRIRGCGAGCEYVAITPEGDIYPCHQFVGKE